MDKVDLPVVVDSNVDRCKINHYRYSGQSKQTSKRRDSCDALSSTVILGGSLRGTKAMKGNK